MNRDQILAKKYKMEIRPVTINGDKVYLRSLNAKDWIEYQGLIAGKPSLWDAAARLVVLTLSDEQGNRIFQDGEESKLIELERAFINSVADESYKMLTEVSVQKKRKN